MFTLRWRMEIRGKSVSAAGRAVDLFFVVLVVCLDLSSGLYFHLKESEKKCFIEELPKDTLVTGSYNLLLFDDKNQIFLPANRHGVQVLVTDPEGSVTLNKIYVAQGRFVFTTHAPGEHVICIGSNSSAWYGGSMMRIHLALSIGPHDYSVVTNERRIPDLQLRIQQLLDQAEMIRKEQEYQREREEMFRDISDNTHILVFICPVIQCLLAFLVGLFQMHHLRQFLVQKKVI